MKPVHSLLLKILLTVTLSLPLQPAFAQPPPAPGAKVRCPVCGMFVAPYPNWQAVIAFADGHWEYFDGPKDLFRYILSTQTHPKGKGVDDILDVWVTEYYSARPVSAKEVYFIGGSDVLGPMGEEMVPVRGIEQAEGFMRDHGGDNIFRFDGRELVEVKNQ